MFGAVGHVQRVKEVIFLRVTDSQNQRCLNLKARTAPVRRGASGTHVMGSLRILSDWAQFQLLHAKECLEAQSTSSLQVLKDR